MDGFSLRTPEQVGETLAARVKALRLAKGWKQATLAERSGVSLASLRRFEASGRVSLQHLGVRGIFRSLSQRLRRR